MAVLEEFCTVQAKPMNVAQCLTSKLLLMQQPPFALMAIDHMSCRLEQ